MKKINIFKLHGQEVLWALSQTVDGAAYAKIYMLILAIQSRTDHSFKTKALNLFMKTLDVFAIRLHIADQLGYEISVPDFWCAYA
ncbi:MAG: hypothetical protein ACTS9Y_01160 [Methylophilus sp.]|uniref:hypothetical protein n=1 Tax=Methylophilus sp. TaxID=29541 RepID=UPI003FA050FF